MSQREGPGKFTLKIIGTNYELMTSGELEELEAQLDRIYAFVETINTRFGVESTEIPTEDEISSVVSEDVPAIKPTRSTTENIRLLFNTDWGKKPRSLAEVMKALEINAVPDKAPSVSIALQRSVKAGILRRIEKEGVYQYYKLPSAE